MKAKQEMKGGGRHWLAYLRVHVDWCGRLGELVLAVMTMLETRTRERCRGS
jgi:hypothetical protein